MKKVTVIIACVLFFLTGCILFFPWNSVQSFAVTKIYSVAANNGIYVAAQNCPAEGVFDKTFVCGHLVADMPLMQMKIDRIAVNPAILRMLSGNLSVAVELGRGQITLATKQQLSWKEGTLSVSADKETVAMHDIDIKGDFSVSGFAEISRANGTISHAQLSMKVPADVENAFEFLSKGMVQGLEKTASGRWRLVR